MQEGIEAVYYTHLDVYKRQKEYGLVVESEPDEGTKVSIRIPAVPYTEENGKILENGYILSKEMCIRDRRSSSRM